jgi:hypothetical protein
MDWPTFPCNTSVSVTLIARLLLSSVSQKFCRYEQNIYFFSDMTEKWQKDDSISTGNKKLGHRTCLRQATCQASSSFDRLYPPQRWRNTNPANVSSTDGHLQVCVCYCSHPPLFDVNWFHEVSLISYSSINVTNFNIFFAFYCTAHIFSNFIHEVSKLDEKLWTFVRLHYHTAP